MDGQEKLADRLAPKSRLVHALCITCYGYGAFCFGESLLVRVPSRYLGTPFPPQTRLSIDSISETWSLVEISYIVYSVLGAPYGVLYREHTPHHGRNPERMKYIGPHPYFTRSMVFSTPYFATGLNFAGNISAPFLLYGVLRTSIANGDRSSVINIFQSRLRLNSVLLCTSRDIVGLGSID